MKTIAKFEVVKVSETAYGGNRTEITKRIEKEPKGTTPQYEYVSTGVPVREITLSAVYDDGISKENKSFADATPNGRIRFTLTNPDLKDEFKPGQNYYVEFIPVEK